MLAGAIQPHSRQRKELLPMRRSLAIVTVLFLMTAVSFGQSQKWQIDPAHSAAQFSVRHLGISTVRGQSTKWRVR